MSAAIGYLPNQRPPKFTLLSLGLQHFLTMIPATLLVAVLTKFDPMTTLFTVGLGTILALLATKRRIPMFYGSSFSYIAVIMTIMQTYDGACFAAPRSEIPYCPTGVGLVQVGILGTAVFEIAFGLLVMRIGKARLDRILPARVTGPVAIIIGLSLAGAALGMAQNNWIVATITLLATIFYSIYLEKKGFLGLIPILLGAITGYFVSLTLGLVDFTPVANAAWFRVPPFTFPAFTDPRAANAVVSVACIAIATIPESTAHLYQVSLYIDDLAARMHKKPLQIKLLIGLNLIADGIQDLVAAFLGGSAGTNYGENISLMAIIKCFSTAVLFLAALLAMALAFVGKLAAVITTIPVAVTGGLAIFLFSVIALQGVALIQSEKVNLFSRRELALMSVILGLGIGGTYALPNGLFPFPIPVVFPLGIPAIVFAAFAGIALNAVFEFLPPSRLAPTQD